MISSTLASIEVRVPGVPGRAHAVVAAGRVDTLRMRRAGGRCGGSGERAALVHVTLAARAAEPACARAQLAGYTHTTVKASSRANC